MKNSAKRMKAWLEDFALFAVIKNHLKGKAWGEWEKGSEG